MKKLQIILLSTLAACIYGSVHDQITVRLCLEYFTVAHPPLFHTTSPTLLALCWGIAATTGLGVVLGFVLAVVSQDGDAPAWSISRLSRALLILLATMAVSAVCAGVLGYELSLRGLISIPADLSATIPLRLHDRFMAVWFAHLASYLVGLGGGAILCFTVWQVRGGPAVISLLPRSRGAVYRAAVLGAVTFYVVWARFGAH